MTLPLSMASMSVFTSRKAWISILSDSAHWCGPCRQFTPILRKVYLNLKKQGIPFEVVFCSKDSDKKGFDEYYGSMPWLAVDFENEELRNNLQEIFAVTGIPRFVMLSPEGVINPNAKDDVMANEAGFPWKQATVKELVNMPELEGKYVGLYFSAHWCGPCKLFTPKLIETYNALKAAGQNFEVVFCSLDNDEDQYKEYYGSMPWLSLGYDSPVVKKLKSILELEGIPTLVLCNTEMEPISADGVEAVKSTGAEGFPWLPSTVKDLNEEPDDINSQACLVYFMEKCDDAAKEANIAVLNEIADQIKSVVSIFYVRESGDVSEQIRGMIGNQDAPLLSIVNIPDEGGYYIADAAEINAESILAFVQGFAEGSIERKQMVA